MAGKPFSQFTSIKGIDADREGLLNAAGVNSLHELAQSEAGKLTGVLGFFNTLGGEPQKAPTEEQVAGWIEQAKLLDPMSVAHAALKERLGKAGTLLTLEEWHKYLEQFDHPTPEQMRFIVDQTRQVMEQIYVHLDMKKARRAIDPVQSLRLLRQRIDDDTVHWDFHDDMLKILKSLGDIHTAYRLPPPHRHSIAFLPILIGKCYETRKRDDDLVRTPQYLVTRTLWEPGPALPMQAGDEIVSWNGVPMHQAVQDEQERSEGSNLDAAATFALQFMTMRWLGADFQPEAPWVIVEYKGQAGHIAELRLPWRIIVLDTEVDDRFMTTTQYLWFLFNGDDSTPQHDGAMNIASHIANVTTMAVFAPHKDADSTQRAADGEKLAKTVEVAIGGGRRSAFQTLSRAHGPVEEANGSMPGKVVSHMASTFEAMILRHDTGDYGYIGIRAFPFSEGNPRYADFVTEFRRLLSLIPHRGLILDVRGNPGGSACNAEMLLQLLCPRKIVPLPFQFLATTLTRDITASRKNKFGQWKDSVDMALRTGSSFTQSRPISNAKDVNYWGQEYFGPVVLLTSASSYSAADFISASFQDHEIGQIIGVDSTTGGGGANVWTYEALLDYLPAPKRRAFHGHKWPRDINLQFAARRCLRINRNTGMPIEELGVRSDPETRHYLTRDDLLNGDADLYAHAMRVLSEQPHHDLHVANSTRDGKPEIVVESWNMDWLDLHMDGRVLQSRDLVCSGKNRSSKTEFQLPPGTPEDAEIEIHGYRKFRTGSVLVARYKHRLTDESK